MSISDGLDPYVFMSKDGKHAVYERINGRTGVFFRQSRHFSFVNNMIKVLFSICTLNWRVSNYVSRQAKGIYRRNEGTIILN